MTNRVLPAALVASCVLMLGLPQASMGQPDAPPPPGAGCYDGNPDYRRLFDQAGQYLDSRVNLREARSLFRLAYRACASTAALEGEARVLLEMKRPYAAYVVLGALGTVPDPERRHRTRELLARLEAEFERRGFGTLSLRYSPRDAEVLLDGEPVSWLPGFLIWRMAPGTHEIAVRREGHGPVVTTVQVPERGDVQANVQLEAGAR